MGKAAATSVVTRTVHAQPSWILRSDQVELAITQLGAHMAPVLFGPRDRKPVQPYYISPWQEEGLTEFPAPVLAPLRGDFFCAPFGGNAAAWKGEKHVPHGEIAGAPWRLVSMTERDGVQTLRIAIRTEVRPGTVTRNVSLVDGHSAVYTQNVLSGYSGPMCYGHHATLALPETAGALRISTSPLQFGMTYPTLYSDPRNREYQSFAIGKTFRSLAKVPLASKEPAFADCTQLPACPGYTNLMQIFAKPAATPGWITAVNQEAGWLWFALKDCTTLPSTVFWICDQGRHGFPWNGRNRCVGLEDICGYFAEGLVPSIKPNILTRKGVKTAVTLSPTTPLAVNYIQGAVRVPAEFATVKKVVFGPGNVTFIAPNGQQVTTPVCHEFLTTGKLTAG